jgi:nucleotide-binding universal stress UspA family protein
MTRRILVPMDGSPSALRALRFAVTNRRGPGTTEVLVLNVQPGILPSRFVSRSMIAEHQARHGEEALKPAREILDRVKLDSECYVRAGDPAKVILDFARETGCREIVMGSRGLGGVKGVLLGSVAMRVAQLAKVPVTLVK